MVGYGFKDITVSVFDIHTTIAPYIEDAAVTYTDNFEFFLDNQAYNRRYEDGKSISSKGFNFDVLPLSTRRNNQFWKYYTGGLNDPDKGFWELHFPYIGTFKREELDLNTTLLRGANQTLKSSLKARVYLSPLGWSTLLTLRLYGKSHPPVGTNRGNR
jgi:hypothetical protein